jgi:hypothetical protein
MIPSSVVNDYLKRQLGSHLWVKQLTAKQLDAALAQLQPPPKLNPRLRLHQKACFLIGVAQPKFCFFLDMGTGKSLLTLELLRYWFQVGSIKRALIFVTSDKAFPTWEKQLVEFGIKLPITALAGSSEQKWQQLEEFGDGLVLIPYPGALAMVCTKVKAKKGKKNKFKLDPKKVARLSAWAGAVVLDESTKCAGESLSFQMIAHLRKNAKVRYALAGRPFGRDPIMLWAQHYLIDGGETLGETKGLFRAAFYNEKPNFWGGPYSKDYTFRDKLKPTLAKMIQHRSITYAADECIDLPKVTSIREVVSFSEEAEQYYRKVLEQVIAAKGNLQEMKSAFLRMRQISSGFIGLRDEEDGTRAEIEFDENPKLDRLLELIEEVPEGHGSVVFYEHTFFGKRIVKELQALGYKPIWLWSGTKDTAGELNRFAKDKQPVAVIQAKVGSFSLDGLQDTANYLFYAESPLGIIEREQSERRLIRQGQKRPVFIYDILVKGTVDQKILDYHKAGQNLFEALLRDPAKVVGTLL